MNIQYIHPADQIVMFMQRVYDKKLTSMSGGNLSVRDNEGNIWITPASIDKGSLTRKDIICVRPNGDCEGPHAPSSELPFHRSVYKLRPDLNAVLHAHPPALVAFSVVRRLPELNLTPTVRYMCKNIKMAAYAIPGSQALSAEVGKVFEQGCNIALLENHGVCVGAADMLTAFQQFETLNYAAELEALATRLGEIRPLSETARQMSKTNVCSELRNVSPQPCSSEELAARRDLIALVRRSYRMGLFTAAQGTYSTRLSDGSFIITPLHTDSAYLEADDLVRIQDGAKEPGKILDADVMLHQKIYAKNPQIGAIAFAQPVHSMVFAVTDMPFDTRTIPESYILLRDVKRIPFEAAYQNLDDVADEFDNAHPVLLIENKSVMVTGASMLQVFDRLEVMEMTAASILKAQALGTIAHIPSDEIAALKTAFHLED